MTRAVVTGGAGFIGSHLAEALARAGDEVVVLDNLSTGRRDNLDACRDQVDFVKGDVRDTELLRKLFDGADVVFHQAALPSVPRSIADPWTSHDANVNGTLSVLIAARDARVRRVVYAASSSAYGDTPGLPRLETMPASPMSPYAVAKLAGELYCRAFHRVYGLEAVGLRYFNVFGPRQDPASQYAAVIPKFITAYLEGRPPTVFGDGEQTRDFTFVENVVQANLLAANAPAERVSGEVFNVGCGERVSLNDLVRDIRSIVGSDVEPTYGPARPGDVRDSQASVDKAREAFGYGPRVRLREGLERTVDWFRLSHRTAPAAASG